MAAQYGEATLSMQGGVKLVKQLYFDDTAGNRVNWDTGNGASGASGEEFEAPADCLLTAICIAAATGQTKTQVIKNNSGTGQILLNALHLASVTSRPSLGTPYKRGDKISLVQLA